MAEEKKNLKRRDMLKVIGAAPAAALVAVTPAASQATAHHDAAAAAKRAHAGGAYQPKVLDRHEWRTVHVLSDLIIPADDRSGSATQAGVPEFVDDWLDFKRGDLLSEIRGGLTWLDMEANRKFGRDFVDAAASEQRTLLDRIAYPAKAAAEDHNAVVFFNHLRDLVVSGFFSSKMGVKDLGYMGNTMLARWDGCPPAALEKLGVSYES